MKRHEPQGWADPAVQEAYRLDERRRVEMGDTMARTRARADVQQLLAARPEAVARLLETVLDQQCTITGSTLGPFTSRSVTLERDLIEQLMDGAGLAQERIVYGECESCVFGPRPRGYTAPCVRCTGVNRSCHMSERQLLALEDERGRLVP